MIAPRIRTNNPCGRTRKRPPTGDRVEHQMANTQSHFSLRINANTIETVIQFCGERMGPRENPPAIPDAPLDRTAFAKGRSADPQPIDPRFLKRRFGKVHATSSTGSGRIGVWACQSMTTMSKLIEVQVFERGRSRICPVGSGSYHLAQRFFAHIARNEHAWHIGRAALARNRT